MHSNVLEFKGFYLDVKCNDKKMFTLKFTDTYIN